MRDTVRMAASSETQVMPVLLDFLALDDSSGCAGQQAGRHGRLFSTQEGRAEYVERVLRPVVQALVHPSGGLHSLDIINEPEWACNEVHPKTSGSISLEHMQRFVAECASHVHRTAPGVAVTVGSARCSARPIL